MADTETTASKNLRAMLKSGDNASLFEIAVCLEEQAGQVMEWRDVGEQARLTLVAALTQAAGAYRIAVAQEQTAYLLQRLVDAAERGK